MDHEFVMQYYYYYKLKTILKICKIDYTLLEISDQLEIKIFHCI